MKPSRTFATLALCLAVAGTAHAGAPQPDTRQGDYAHVCRSGPQKNQACTVATEETDCPSSESVVKTLSGVVNGTLTLIAHDAVTDWASGEAANQALTVLLEVDRHEQPAAQLRLVDDAAERAVVVGAARPGIDDLAAMLHERPQNRRNRPGSALGDLRDGLRRAEPDDR